MGFLVTSDEEGNFYYSGDTALTMDVQLIPNWAIPDFAVLPIRGDDYTMGPEDALEAARMVKTQTVMGVHYDTWPIIHLDKEKARKIFDKAGIALSLPSIGETVNLPK